MTAFRQLAGCLHMYLGKMYQPMQDLSKMTDDFFEGVGGIRSHPRGFCVPTAMYRPAARLRLDDSKATRIREDRFGLYPTGWF